MPVIYIKFFDVWEERKAALDTTALMVYSGWKLLPVVVTTFA